MKQFRIFILVVTGILFFNNSILAQETVNNNSNLSSAVIDIQKIFNESKIGIETKAKMQQIEKELKTKADKISKDFTTWRDNARKQVKNLSREKVSQLLKQVQTKEKAAGDKIKKLEVDANKKAQFYKQNLMQNMVKYVSQLAKEKKLSIILKSDAVFVYDFNVDITEDVIKLLNAQKLPLPKYNNNNKK